MTEIAVKLATSAGKQLLESIAGKVYAGISKEVLLLVGVSKEIQYIIDELAILSAFLRDAEKKQLDNEAARAWVVQVKHVSYVIEDWIEDFSFHLDRHRRGNHLSPSCLRPGSLGARHRIAIEVQSIKSRVEEVSSRRMRYGIANTASRADDYPANVVISQHNPRLSAVFVEDAQLVGIEGPRDKLVGWLSDETERKLRVIAVVGEGGIGKTTVVKKAYESPKVISGHFQCRAWIAVSQMYSIDEILRDLFEQLNGPVDHKGNPGYLKMGREQLIANTRNYLEDKRYMVVFDDIWMIDAWKELELALPEKELGSRILLTTRNLDLAKRACGNQTDNQHIHHHQKLSWERSMELFSRRAFNSPTNTCPEDLKSPTKMILEKCDGLPLAIISIAGVVASKPREEWEKLLRRLGSELEHNPNLADMKHILMLSYGDLPYHVRHCFLYLSKFPEDYLIKRKRIQRLWVAEGFISSRADMSAEEVAESYFNELANRFMIIPSYFSKVNGKVKNFRLHDIMLELMLLKSREENFVCVVRKGNVWTSQDMIRRLSVQFTNTAISSPSHIRSLTMYTDHVYTDDGLMTKLFSPSVGLLQLLDLDGCNYLRDNHLPAVSELIHLRYLSLKNRSPITKLPNRFGNLKMLETLDIRIPYISKLPQRMTELHKLRHLLSRPLQIPTGISKLRGLQTLAINAERSGKRVMKELGEITQLRKLHVRGLKEEHLKDFGNSLNAMSSSLRSLSVEGAYYDGLLSTSSKIDLSGLSNLSSPPLLLDRLKLATVCIMQIPSWFLSLNNLLKLDIFYCQLEKATIQSLGTLPNLSLLTLASSYYDSLSFGAQQFSRLKDLRLHCEYFLKSVSFEERAMPLLESIFLVSRYESHHALTISGILNLPSLKELKTNIHRGKEALEQQCIQHPNHPDFLLDV